jgi:DNA polymerase-3 subunit gamma/tau
VLELLRSGIDEGRSASQIVKDLINHFRNILFAKVGAVSSLELTKEYQGRILEQSGKFNFDIIKSILRALSRAELDMKWHPQARLVLEVALLELIGDRGSVTVTTPVSKSEARSSAEQRTTNIDTGIVTDKRLTVIKSKWNEILEKVKKQSLYGYVSLHEGEPVEINSKGKLVIGFRKGYGFHKDRLEEKKNKDAVELAIKESTGENILIEGQVLDQKSGIKQQVSVEVVKEIFEGELI